MASPLFDRLILPSTRAFRREWRSVPGYTLGKLLHGYLYARWPYLYISLAVGEHPFAKWLERVRARFGSPAPPRTDRARPAAPTPFGSAFADTYHGKVVPLDSAREIITIDRDLSGTYPEQVIPFHHAREIILRNPLSIVVFDCPCRVSRAKPCLPLDVCIIVGEPFASFILEHQPERARRITPEEAVAIIEAEDRRGHVHHAFFKDAMLERFYAICNCCTCCCGAIQGHRNGVPMLAPSGYVAQVEADRCAGCGTCVTICQFHATSLQNGVSHIDPTLCMGCGICDHHCPNQALSLERDPSRGEPLEIRKLVEEAEARSN